MANSPIGIAVLASEVAALQNLSDKLVIQGRNLSQGIVYANEEILHSTVFSLISAGAVVSAGIKQFFAQKVGDNAPGLGFQLTAAQTNWNGNGSALTETEAFVGLRVGFEAYIADPNNGQYLFPLADPKDLAALLYSTTWKWTEANLVAREQGVLADYPHGTGIFSSGAAATAAATGVIAASVQNGGPNASMTETRIPVIWKPLVNYTHTAQQIYNVTLGTDGYDPSSKLLAVRMRVYGYRLSRFA